MNTHLPHVDAHVHLFEPDRYAPMFVWHDRQNNIASLRDEMAEYALELAMVSAGHALRRSTGNDPHALASINDDVIAACAISSPQLLAALAMQPGQDNPTAAVTASQLADPVVRAISMVADTTHELSGLQRALPAAFQLADDHDIPLLQLETPHLDRILPDLAELLARHPRVSVLLAAMGRHFWRSALLAACHHANLLLDTADMISRLRRAMFPHTQRLTNMIRLIPEQVLLSGHWPYVAYGDIVRDIDHTIRSLPDEVALNISSRNALRALRIDTHDNRNYT